MSDKMRQVDSCENCAYIYHSKGYRCFAQKAKLNAFNIRRTACDKHVRIKDRAELFIQTKTCETCKYRTGNTCDKWNEGLDGHCITICDHWEIL